MEEQLGEFPIPKPVSGWPFSLLDGSPSNIGIERLVERQEVLIITGMGTVVDVGVHWVEPCDVAPASTTEHHRAVVNLSSQMSGIRSLHHEVGEPQSHISDRRLEMARLHSLPRLTVCFQVG